MTAPIRLERDLTAWLSETAMPQTPDYVDDILAKTSRIRQRPRWAFVGRWLPLRSVGVIAPVAGRTALRSIALLVVLGLLVAAIAAFVGSRRSVPAPFGPAGNGLLAYDQGGAIFLIDPDTKDSQRIVAPVGGGNHHPRWSRDGTRLVYVRDTGERQLLVVTDSTGRDLAITEAFRNVDSDSLMWSPDGRQIAIGADGRLGRAIYLLDATDGSARALPVQFSSLEMYWRPPHGNELLFHSDGKDPGLSVVSVEDGTVRRVTPREVDPLSFRPLGWTPDGRAFLYQQPVEPDGHSTFVRDVQTGDEVRLDVMFGHVSNDGTRVAGLDDAGRPCVVAITGGRCEVIPNAPSWVGSTSGAMTWSPNDRWLAISAGDGTGTVWLLDPTGVVPPRALVNGDSGSWQRTTP